MMTRSLYLAMAASVGGLLGFYLLVSTVPSYVALGGAGDLGAGLATGALMLATVLMELAVPKLLATYGYRAAVALGLLLLSLPSLALPLSSGLPLVLAVCLLRGAGLGILMVTGTALMAELVPLERRGEGLGLYGVAVGIPSIVGLPIGLWVAEHVGHTPVFLAAGVLPLLALAAVPGLPSTKPVRATGRGSWSMAGLVAPTLVFTAVTVSVGVIMTFLPLAASPGVVSLAMLIQSLTTPAARWWAGRFGDRNGAKALLTPSLLATAAGIACLAVGDPVVTLAGIALFGAGFGVAMNVTLTMMLERNADSGKVSAVWNLAYDGGMGLGAAGFGLVMGVTGYAAGFVVTAVLVLAAIVPGRRTPSAEVSETAECLS
ncbi:MFS transporter [Nonomuraea sp. NPDC050556]|uniref:MFS transporter n=1 Tax=Nonomuraea sp. NPDC050556 TaxID=3364369 RepID=UPI00378FFBD4